MLVAVLMAVLVSELVALPVSELVVVLVMVRPVRSGAQKTRTYVRCGGCRPRKEIYLFHKRRGTTKGATKRGTKRRTKRAATTAVLLLLMTMTHGLTKRKMPPSTAAKSTSPR